MVKTVFYVAGGQNSTKLSDCSKICEIRGILYDNDRNMQKWVFNKTKQLYTERIVLDQSDEIDSDGITRRIIFNIGS